LPGGPGQITNLDVIIAGIYFGLAGDVSVAVANTDALDAGGTGRPRHPTNC
jgi:hypothetical protein